MKRHGNLWPQVFSFEALLRAAEQACKGKRFRPGVAAFHFNLEPELWKLHEELSTKTYRPGAYRTFVICEPKLRQNSALRRTGSVDNGLARSHAPPLPPLSSGKGARCRRRPLTRRQVHAPSPLPVRPWVN